ncbi:MAG TPA: PilZ domain-containing protein [Devosiaceae bacterium]|nr:PilZ domain-containing protein [Devosiaceae bacterium]
MNENFIRFEADVQRQHARYQLPIRCVIDGQTCKALDWSVAGVGIETPGARPLVVGATPEIRLLFAFEGYEFALDLKAEVRHSSAERTGLQYIQLQPEQTRMMRYVLDSYLSGELLTMGEVLDLQRRPVQAGARREGDAQRPSGGLRHGLGIAVRTAGVGVVTLLLVGFIGSSLYQRFVTFPAASAFITSDTTPIYASVGGTATNVASGKVVVGDQIATILTDSGRSVTETSPCACTIEEVAVNVGETVRGGTRLFSLHRPDSKNFVLATVDRSRLMDIYRGVTADIEFVDRPTIYNAHVEALPAAATDDTGSTVSVRLDLGPAAASVPLGQPVQVSLFKAHWLDQIKLDQIKLGWLQQMIAGASFASGGK